MTFNCLMMQICETKTLGSLMRSPDHIWLKLTIYQRSTLPLGTSHQSTSYIKLRLSLLGSPAIPDGTNSNYQTSLISAHHTRRHNSFERSTLDVTSLPSPEIICLSLISAFCQFLFFFRRPFNNRRSFLLVAVPQHIMDVKSCRSLS